MPKEFRYVRLTKHVKDRMSQRRIQKEQIVDVLKNPDIVITGRGGETHRKALNGKTLVVGWILDKQSAVVRTAYWQELN